MFQFCNMGGELVSVEGLGDSLRQPFDPDLINEPRGIPLKLGSASELDYDGLCLSRVFAVSWFAIQPTQNRVWTGKHV